MNCPQCGKNTTIVYAGEQEGSKRRTHYCWWGTDVPSSQKIYSHGTESGCGTYLKEGWNEGQGSLQSQLQQHAKWLESRSELKDDKPLDPWGAPVDTRGYPS